jgi:four helix bundle protein
VAEKIRVHRDLKVYQRAFEASCQIYSLTRTFPVEERYALTDQINRSSRSVCANLAEAWRKRRYEKAFISKLSDAEAEAGETQVWIEFTVAFGYLDRTAANSLYQTYDEILRMIVSMIARPETWIIDGDKKIVAEDGESYGEPF